MAILVTGGAGYIGSHTAVKLLQSGSDVVVLDNLSNSKVEVLSRIQLITNKSVKFVFGDVSDAECLKNIFNKFEIESVFHFAGLKSVEESIVNPKLYFENNVHGSEVLLNEMSYADTKTIVFSSSATVYGQPVFLPYTEKHALSPINPYGKSKLLVEEMLEKFSKNDSSWNIAILRYFNPVGAHSSGLIGENPVGVPKNLMPFLCQAALGLHPNVSIFGHDYDSPDGTAIRDYIHVEDLAEGHLAALNYVNKVGGLSTFNLGTGNGTSVLELIKVFEDVCGKKLALEFKDRREGDLPSYWADVTLANQVLNWSAKLNIHEMCTDAWNWQKMQANQY